MFAVLRSKNLKVCGAAGLLCLATLAFAEEPAWKRHRHGAESSAKQDKKWETDEAVRQGMDSIRQLMTASRENIEKEKMTVQDYRQLADAVDKQVATIEKNHKLPKDAYKALYVVALTDLSRGTELMRNAPKVQAQHIGALEVLQSLRNYGQYFNHPGWTLDAAKAR